MEKLLYKIPEACELLSIGRTKFYELRDAGEVEVVKVGASVLVPAQSLRVLAERLRAAGARGQALVDLIDESGRIDVASIPAGTTLADLEAAKRLISERPPSAA